MSYKYISTTNLFNFFNEGHLIPHMAPRYSLFIMYLFNTKKLLLTTDKS
jgi:hypothetical protein